MKKLSIIMGIPCSGKTTYASTLKGRTLHIDEFRKMATGSYKPGEFDILVYRLVLASVDYFLDKGESVVVDGAFLTEKSRSNYVRLGKKHNADVDLYFIDTDHSIILERVSKRNLSEDKDRHISSFQIEKYSKQLELPTMNEGFSSIYRV